MYDISVHVPLSVAMGAVDGADASTRLDHQANWHSSWVVLGHGPSQLFVLGAA